MSKRKPYVRSMDGWWKKNPYFVEYMVHEATSLFVTGYALTLLFGLFRLSQGEAAWNGWLEAMKSTPALVANVAFLIAIAYHAYTWFVIMPKTLPPIIVGGKKLGPCAITGTGLAAVAAVSLIVFGLVWRIAQ